MNNSSFDRRYIVPRARTTSIPGGFQMINSQPSSHSMHAPSIGAVGRINPSSENGDASIFINVSASPFDMSGIRGAEDAKASQIHPNEWVFTMNNPKLYADEDQAKNPLLSLWQLNIILALMHQQGLAEWSMYYGEIMKLQNRSSASPTHSLLFMSEDDLWNIAQTTRGDKSGLLNVVAFLCRRYVVDLFSFVGITKTNAEIQSPEGYGHSVIGNGVALANSCFLTPTKQCHRIFLIMKRRYIGNREWGAFGYHLVSTSDAAGPTPQITCYLDNAGYKNYGAVYKVGFIVDKPTEDPNREYALQCCGLTNASLSDVHMATLGLKKIKIGMANSSVVPPIKCL